MKELKTKLRSEGWEAIASRNMDFFDIATFMPGATVGLKKIFGQGYKKRITVGKEKFFTSYGLREDIEKLGEIVREKFINAPERFKKFLISYQKAVRELNSVMVKLVTCNYSQLTNEELIDFVREYNEKYCNISPYGLIGNRVAMAGFITTIKDYLFKKKYHLSFNEVYDRLIIPPKLTIGLRKELDFYKLVVFLSKDKELKIKINKLFRNSKINKLVQLLVLDDRVNKVISDYLRDYRWILIAVQGRAWEKKFLLRFKKLIKVSVSDLSKKIFQLESFWKQSRIMQKKLLDDLSPPLNFKRAVNILSEFVSLRDHHGLMIRYAPIKFRPLLKEIAKRLNIDDNDVVFLTSGELINALTKSISYKKIIQSRKKLYVVVDDCQGQRIFTGFEAKRFLKQNLFIDLINKDKENITGQIACRGIVRGVARVISTVNELKTMKTGEILVSPNTTPEMMVAIKKARAIVTDEGGLGSHAAIVSREFSIPCVVGTRDATQIIKTGELIEVNADKGYVKRF